MAYINGKHIAFSPKFVQGCNNDQVMNSILGRTISGELNCNAETIGRTGLAYCAQLTKVKAPFATLVDNSAMYGCVSLETFDVGNPSANGLAFYLSSFGGCSSFEVLAIRTTKAVATLQGTGAFTGTLLAQGKGLILVPMDMIEQYQAATNWSAVGSTFRPIEMYTKDGTVTGELDEEAIAAFFSTLG